MSAKARLEWVDVAKGFGIIGVIWAHVAIDDSIIHPWLTSFDLVLFFFLSGYVLNIKDDFGFFLKKKLKANVLIYFLVSIPIILFSTAMNVFQHTFSINDFTNMLRRILVQDRYLIIWYLACLFMLNVVTYILLHITRDNVPVSFLISVLLATAGVIYSKNGGKPLPWNIDACATTLPFFYLGYLFKQKKIFERYMNTKDRMMLVFVGGFILNTTMAVGSYLITGEVLDINDSKYGFPLFSYIGAIAGTLVFISLAHLVRPKVIRFIGINSLYYYAWHNDIMKHIVNRVLKAFGLIYDEEWSFAVRMLYWSGNIFLIVFGLTICVVIIKFLKRVFGRKVEASI